MITPEEQAIKSAMANGGKLTRLPNGKWRGLEREGKDGSVLHESSVVYGLVKAKTFSYSKLSHGEKGYGVEVTMT